MIAGALLVAASLSFGAPANAPATSQSALREDAAPADPVEREWRVRAWALSPAVGGELRSALASDSWRVRDEALDALARGLDVATLRASAVAELLPAVRALAADPDAPDQARALTVLARWPGPVSLPAAAALVEHPLPAVRLALTDLLGAACSRAEPARLELLADLMLDTDLRVARTALRAWAAAPGPGPDWARVPEESFEVLLQSLELRGAPDPVLVSLSEHVAHTLESACLVEALRLRLHGAGASGVIAMGWRAEQSHYGRGLLSRASRVASLGTPALGDLLFERYSASPAQLEWLLPEVVRASDPMHLLARTEAWVRLDPESRLRAGRQVWSLLIGREVRWDEAVVEPWLRAPEVELREQVARTLSTVDPAHSEGAVGRLLVRALDDAAPRIARQAFRALGKADDPRPWLASLHAYWAALPPDQRLDLLTYLPRAVPVSPFRDDLLEFVRAGPPPAVVLGLLESLGPDPELARAVGAWLDLQLEDYLALPSPGAEQFCIALARAYVPLAGEDALPRLELLLSRTAPTSEKLAKFAAASLGRTPTGRALLERREGDDLPSRIQIEIALALAGAGGSESFVALLAERYDGCDWELRSRVLAVCAGRACATSFDLLRRVALDPHGGADELRDSACRALAPRGAPAVDVLALLIASTEPVELRTVAIRALGQVPDPRARDLLLERLRGLPLDSVASASPSAGLDDFAELVLFERAALIETLARQQPVPDWLVADWLRRPRDEARRDLSARFIGTKLAATEFRWRTELAFAAAAASAGQLAGALERSGNWARIDGRCLAVLGGTGLAAGDARSPEPARELLDAALVALAGEGPAPDRAAVLLFTRKRAWLAAERAQDWPAAVVHARGLLDLRLEGRVGEVLWVAELGEFDPGASHDPEARLRRAVVHAEGRIDVAGSGR